MTTHELAAAIAAALGPEWTHEPNSETTFSKLTRQPDGLALFLRGDHRDRLEIRADAVRCGADQYGNRTHYYVNAPSITVAMTRTPESIARDMRSRLLPDCETWYAAALRWRTEMDESAARKQLLRSRVLAFAGAKEHSFGSTRIYGPGWECDPQYDDTVLLTFRQLPAEVALALLRAYDAATQTDIWR